MRKLPSLRMLRVFEEACHTLSFSKAAEALFMTQSAASRQIKQLENFLGKSLFIRGHRGLELTQDAMTMLPIVRQSLDLLEEGVKHVQLSNPLQHLRLQVAPTFATRWLAPRLVTLLQRNSQLQIALISEIRQKYCDFDSAIRFGDIRRDLSNGLLLCYEQLCLVASPLVMQQGRFPPLTALPQLHILNGDSRLTNWQQWLDAAQITVAAGHNALEFSTQDQVISACTTGAGYAVLDILMISHELDNGLLRQVLPLTVTSTHGYWLEIPQDKGHSPRVIIFQEWLQRELKRDIAKRYSKGEAKPLPAVL
ncbi:LysR family transcriptional regulator [Yersinia pseudotuberculosis]|uniref:LysR family transcriptional regulator n=1 Tax=Yersinia pseudotuberculosis TaxID=633 RepID=UPI00061C7DD8|nr:LysR family transcriptional regulator [Yersinia pseudotuberculosis]CNF83372.1 LysR family transcriptional regulator [Yersinia pseudotuberculosis]